MSVAIEQVPMWLILDGRIGHVLGQTKSGWHWTICGKWTPNGVTAQTMPARICRACRKRLKYATQSASVRSDE